eukprot:TRINITY_DN372_c0_g2_i1.p2 TRINITY_DN372_c0_g2~~TRINITY_DN372_c0_g2_i1.p2  ORF type:complete len:189 (-),score=50.66 TRINITY_DN372_c0_g2_i1:181-747(-)
MPDTDDFDELDDEVFDKYREERINALKKQLAQKQRLEAQDHGKYTEVEEKEFLKITTTAKHVVAHFFSKDFMRCKIMDKHMEALAKKHFGVRFVRINVEKAAFFVDKLAIKVLPAVVCFIDGITVDRLIGFDELGNTDNFRTEVFEKRLAQKGVLVLPEQSTTTRLPKRRPAAGSDDDADADDDDDDD